VADEYTLYNGVLPHSDDDTSLQAALSMRAISNNMREDVFDFIEEQGDVIDEDIEKCLGMRHQTASARRRELVLLGRVKHSGTYRPTTSGRAAKVWVLA
jgi:hypothetical protein